MSALPQTPDIRRPRDPGATMAASSWSAIATDHEEENLRPWRQRLSHKADSEHGLFGLVQKLHLPFGILFQLARDTADHVAADMCQLSPRRLVVGELNVRLPGELAVSDTEEIVRHGETAFSFGRAALAALRESSLLADWVQTVEGPTRKTTAVCPVARRYVSMGPSRRSASAEGAAGTGR